MVFHAPDLRAQPFFVDSGTCGCDPLPEDVAVSQKHHKDGIAFQHSGNWKVTGDTAEQKVPSCDGRDAGGALVIVQNFPAKGAATFKDDADAFSASAAGEAPAGVVSKRKFAEHDSRESL